MYELKIKEYKTYDVLINRNFFIKEIENIIVDYLQVVYFIDNNIVVTDKFNMQYVINIYATEENKSIDYYLVLINKLLNLKINRSKTLFVAIGGGITLDLVGFIASTYKRGVDVVYVPTTLLAMVDVAIGSKNGLNILGIKNQIGNFYAPKKVIIDIDFLDTLPRREFNSAMAEIIKCGAIKDISIINDLEQDENIDLIIYKTLKVKQFFIEADPNDLGIRKSLNFGHTYGHAIESYGNFNKYLHGEAVSIGMNMMFDNERLKKICLKYNLPIKTDISIESLNELVCYDKKIVEKLEFVTLYELGIVNV